MYRDCPAKLGMERVILGDGFFDESVYTCKIIRYIPEEESIYLLTGKTELPAFSLDALYNCSIYTENTIVKCEGFITERYMSKLGKVIVFRVKSGFYKNPLN